MARRQTRRRKEKKNVEVGVAHIQSTFNNTVVTITDKSGNAISVHDAVAHLHKEYPHLVVDGEMQVNVAINTELRDSKYPFTTLKGKDVNTLIFPCLSAASSSYKMLQALSPDTEIIGPIQMGLNKPIHFMDFESTVQEIMNVVAVAAIDAIVDKKK